jgi:hypothetical protein
VSKDAASGASNATFAALFSMVQTDSFDSIRPLRLYASQNGCTTSRRGHKARRKPFWGEIGWGKTAVLSDLEMRANTHMGMTFSHLLPGIAKFAAAAITSWFSADSTLIRNSVILLLSFIILGAAVAIIARKVDPRLYVAAVRRSVKAIKRSVKSQGQSTDSQMLQTLQQAIDEGSASLDFDIAGPDQPAANLPALSSAEAKPPAEAQQIAKAPQIDKVVAADTSMAILPAASVSSAAIPESEFPPLVVPESAREMHQETPSPWHETASSLMAAFADPGTNHESLPLTRSISEVATESAQKSAQNSPRNSEPNHAQDPAPAPEENAPRALPRLSELRGMCFSQALRELDRAKRSAQPTLGSTPGPTPEIDALLRAIAPFESLIMQMESVTHETENTSAANENGAKKYPPQSDFLPVKPVAPVKAHGHHGEDNGRSLPGRKPPGGVHDDQLHVDQMQILPSRRGQYKKKT